MKNLKKILAKNSGRSKGKIVVRHQGGREKRFLREIDFKKNKFDIWGKVEKIEYDPNRNVEIALILYKDGERRYSLSPKDLKVGDKIISSAVAPIEVGNTLPLGKIPVGTAVHNLEITIGKGGQMVRSAGAAATVYGKEENSILIKMPSAEIRRFKPECLATIGRLGRVEARTERIGKAGRRRHMGIRPTVRGVAMHPGAHPHGGGEGRSPVGLKFPKTVYGKKAVGNTRKPKKYSNKLIIKKRKLGTHH